MNRVVSFVRSHSTEFGECFTTAGPVTASVKALTTRQLHPVDRASYIRPSDANRTWARSGPGQHKRGCFEGAPEPYLCCSFEHSHQLSDILPFSIRTRPSSNVTRGADDAQARLHQASLLGFVFERR